jgi:hypothetical protein
MSDIFYLGDLAMANSDSETQRGKYLFWGAMQIGDFTARPPKGARGRLVSIMASAAEDALPSLLGAPITMNHEGPVVGVIHRAKLAGGWLFIAGRGSKAITQAAGLGLSYDAKNVSVTDIRARRWTVSSIGRFSGVAAVITSACHGTKLKVVAPPKSWWQKLLSR